MLIAQKVFEKRGIRVLYFLKQSQNKKITKSFLLKLFIYKIILEDITGILLIVYEISKYEKDDSIVKENATLGLLKWMWFILDVHIALHYKQSDISFLLKRTTKRIKLR